MGPHRPRRTDLIFYYAYRPRVVSHGVTQTRGINCNAMRCNYKYSVPNMNKFTQYLTKFMTDIVTNNAAQIVSEQRIQLSNLTSDGDLNVGPINQTVIAKIDSRSFIKSVPEETFKFTIREAAALASITINENRYSYSQFTADVNTVFNSQSIVIDYIKAAEIEIDSINQYIQVDILCTIIAKSLIEDPIPDLVPDLPVLDPVPTPKDNKKKIGLIVSMSVITFIIIIFIAVTLIASVLFLKSRRGRVSALNSP